MGRSAGDLCDSLSANKLISSWYSQRLIVSHCAWHLSGPKSVEVGDTANMPFLFGRNLTGLLCELWNSKFPSFMSREIHSNVFRHKNITYIPIVVGIR